MPSRRNLEMYACIVPHFELGMVFLMIEMVSDAGMSYHHQDDTTGVNIIMNFSSEPTILRVHRSPQASSRLFIIVYVHLSYVCIAGNGINKKKSQTENLDLCTHGSGIKLSLLPVCIKCLIYYSGYFFSLFSPIQHTPNQNFGRTA